MKISHEKFDQMSMRCSLKGTNYNMSVVSTHSKQVRLSENSEINTSKGVSPKMTNVKQSLNSTEHFEKNPFVKKKEPKKHLNI